jgi:acyl transferase domain-containing protein
VFVIEYALAQLLQEWGIRPQAMLGYSLGEYVAACLAGVLSLEDALVLVARRAQLIAQVPEGAMLAIALSQDAVELFLDEQVCLAAVTGLNTCVLAGPVEAIEQLEARLNEQEIVTRRVETTHAFHSSMLEPLRKPVQELVSGFTLNEPQIPYIPNVTGTWITAEQATDPAYWATHMCQTVRFAEGVGRLLEEHEHVLVEVGPGQSLSAYVRQHPACGNERLSFVVPTLPSIYERQPEHASLLTALGKLWLAGVTPDWAGFYTREHRQRVSLPTYPFERQRYWIEPPRTGLLEKQAPRISRDKKPDVADWFYLPAWEQVPLPPVEQEVTQGTWLVFADEFGLGTQIIKRLAQKGCACICVQPGEKFAQLDEQHFTLRPGATADYQALCKTLSSMGQVPKIILHGWSLAQKDEVPGGREHFYMMQERGFYSLLFLAQALGAQIYADPLQIVVVSNYMQAVTGCETLHPEKVTILGACKVIPQENLNITCRSVDIAVPSSRTFADVQLIDRIIAECATSMSNHAVAYRGATRWVQKYQPVRLEAVKAEAPVLREQGVYLITGGLGKVGLILAAYLAQAVQARLVLVGRTSVPAREDWQAWLSSHHQSEPTSHTIRQVQALEDLGAQVLVLQADVADRQQMQAVLEQTQERFGGLHGIIHAAGISQEAAFRPVQEIGRKECEWHYQPKVYGTYVLEEVLAGRAYDFCLLCSSLSAVLGGLGFVGYTAANSFVDAFVERHNQGAEVPWMSVNWDSWQVKEDPHGELGGTIAAYTMSAQEGVEAFRRVLASGMSRLINSTGDLQSRIRQWIQLETLQDSSETGQPPSIATRPNLSNPYVAPSDEYEQKIAAVWEQVLGIEQIGLYDNFFDLGGHSLMGTQLISRLRQVFQVNLPLATLFEAPTVAELALAIKMLLIEEIDKLDEEEVKSLI